MPAADGWPYIPAGGVGPCSASHTGFHSYGYPPTPGASTSLSNVMALRSWVVEPIARGETRSRYAVLMGCGTLSANFLATHTSRASPGNTYTSKSELRSIH